MNITTAQKSGNPESSFYTPIELAKILERVKLNQEENIIPPEPCIVINQNEEVIPIGTLGGISIISGKAKSRKTFLVSLLVGRLYQNTMQDTIQGCLPEKQRTTLYFDTEQGRYHASRTQYCIRQVSGQQELTSLNFYHLREFSPTLRLLLIDHAINTSPNIGLVVIDGLRDLITAINDESQATMLTGYLMKWTAEKNIHVIGVIHENKGDSNVRGHIGTELVNKAETVISVSIQSQGDSYSKVEAKYTRDKLFHPFFFTINQNGVPEIIDAPEKKSKPKKTPSAISVEVYKRVLARIFNEAKQLNKQNLFPKLKSSLEEEGVVFGDTLCKDAIEYLHKEMKLIDKNDSYFSLAG